MEKTVTKAEVERVLNLYICYSERVDNILNELFPSFKVGDYLTPIESNGTLNAKTGDVCVVDSIDDEYVHVKWISFVRQNNGNYGRFNFRHATPEEIAAAEWESGKPYRVDIFGGIVLISSHKVGHFYKHGGFDGEIEKHDKYEKL